MKLVRMKSGHGDVLLAEGDPELAEDEERLIAEFRRQLELGMWAAVPTAERGPSRGGDGARVRRGPARRRARDLLPQRRRAAERWTRPSDARASCCARSSATATTRPTSSSGSSRSPAATRATPTSSIPTGRWSPTTPRPGELLAEYCVGFADEGERLPPADDVLAKWMSAARARVRPDRRGEPQPARPPGRSADRCRGRSTSPGLPSEGSSIDAARRPLVAYDLETGELLGELCVTFPDRSDSASGSRLPDADDVLAKWIALRRRRARPDRRGARTSTCRAVSSIPAT